MEIAGAKLAMNAVAASSATPATAPVDALAGERFNAIMQSGQTPAAVALPASPASPIPPPTGAEMTMGERILNGLSGLSSDFQKSWQNVNAVLEGSDKASTADLLKLQLNLTQMSVQYDLVGKVVSRSTQNIDQLVKLQ